MWGRYVDFVVTFKIPRNWQTAENLEMRDLYRFYIVLCKGSVLNVANQGEGYDIKKPDVVTNCDVS